MINDILDLAKAESGKMQMAMESVEAAEVVADSIRMVRDRAAAQQVAIETHLPQGSAAWLGDRQKIAQILVNLLSNAVKFTPAGGRIAVEIQLREPEWLEVAVADTGIGMSAEELPKVLEPFGQIDGALARRYDGTGLGLPLAKTLAELHGGALRIESEPGIGTTVTVRLPCRGERAHA